MSQVDEVAKLPLVNAKVGVSRNPNGGTALVPEKKDKDVFK